MDKQKLRKLGLLLFGLLFIQGFVIAYNPWLFLGSRAKATKDYFAAQDFANFKARKKTAKLDGANPAISEESTPGIGEADVDFLGNSTGISSSDADGIGFYYSYLFKNGDSGLQYAWKKFNTAGVDVSAARYAADSEAEKARNNLCLNGDCITRSLFGNGAAGTADSGNYTGQKILVASNEATPPSSLASPASFSGGLPNTLSTATRQFNDRVFPQQTNLGDPNNNNGGGSTGNNGGDPLVSAVPVPSALVLLAPLLLMFGYRRKQI